MEPFWVFSTRDIKKMFPGMNNMNLVRWHQKGYLIKIIKGWYCFSDYEPAENISWLIANLIYSPSYISLHSAFSPDFSKNPTEIASKYFPYLPDTETAPVKGAD